VAERLGWALQSSYSGSNRTMPLNLQNNLEVFMTNFRKNQVKDMVRIRPELQEMPLKPSEIGGFFILILEKIK
jgi:hypothetical protein